MSRELLINITPQAVRVARIEDGVVEALHIENVGRHGTVGNIYLGRVSRVLPGMQAAFVDIGQERAGFLHMSDLNEGQVLTAGMTLAVQVMKDPLGGKGARLTACISLPSRRLVLMPGGSGIGVSSRIDEGERMRLREVMATLPELGVDGFIVRTAAEGATYDVLRGELVYLHRLWEVVRSGLAAASAPSLVHEELPIVQRMIRDLAGTYIDRILVDSREAHTVATRFAGAFLPELDTRIELHDGSSPLFDAHGVEKEIECALDRRVPLKSGGHLVIDQAEALVAVDVNTGGYVGKKNLEETALKTNVEAAKEIARQLRLRNLGGIIIIDFIDMEVAEHRGRVLEVLAGEVKRDHASTRIGSVSSLGLVEMTRSRNRESLAELLCEPCRECAGRGTVRVHDH